MTERVKDAKNDRARANRLFRQKQKVVQKCDNEKVMKREREKKTNTHSNYVNIIKTCNSDTNCRVNTYKQQEKYTNIHRQRERKSEWGKTNRKAEIKDLRFDGWGNRKKLFTNNFDCKD